MFRRFDSVSVFRQPNIRRQGLALEWKNYLSGSHVCGRHILHHIVLRCGLWITCVLATVCHVWVASDWNKIN
jgi:hypothetical protein